MRSRGRVITVSSADLPCDDSKDACSFGLQTAFSCMPSSGFIEQSSLCESFNCAGKPIKAVSATQLSLTMCCTLHVFSPSQVQAESGKARYRKQETARLVLSDYAILPFAIWKQHKNLGLP